MISGSMSKGVLDADGDVDFFIVTQPGRLWIARVLLTLFKRIFLLNSYKNFCLNYFVDSEHLEIPDQNVFTATEVALIMPMFNDELYKIFLEQNLWYKQYYPNIEPMQHTKTSRKSVLSRWFEALLGEKMADNLDDYFMKLTRRYLKRKYSHLSPDQFESDLMSTKSVSRHHPERQQYRIIQKYEGIKAELRSKLAENG